MTSQGIEVKTGVISAIGERYFGKKFDVDKFISSSQTEQLKQLELLAGLDFSEINKAYKITYDSRTYLNRRLKELDAQNLEEPIEPENNFDIDLLEKELLDIENRNDLIHENYGKLCSKISEEIKEHNKKRLQEITVIEQAKNAFEQLEFAQTYFQDIEIDKYRARVEALPAPRKAREYQAPEFPKLEDTKELNAKINKAMQHENELKQYQSELNAFRAWAKSIVDTEKEIETANTKLQTLTDEKKEMIKGASIPPEFEITETGITYNGLPISNEQLSSSAKYIAALKLGALLLGEVRSIHFDASFLDNQSLSDIQDWAKTQDLQLLIERPDFEGGEIQYQILNK